MKNYITNTVNTYVIGLFLVISFGCGNDIKKTESKTESKKESKETFCGKKFKSSSTIEAIGMTKNYVTILSCNGTYVSSEDWGTSEQYDETYKNTIGRSSGNNESFYGTWTIVDKVSDVDADKLINSDERSCTNGTMIRYTSNLGKTRYAKIYKYDFKLWLSPIAYSIDVDYKEKSYQYKDLNMYDGNCYLD
jgi:hypothetical protein